ncbi:T9SS type A sorting domain-containing protein [Hymenobacter metallicola]|uniref:T9SS type A sorting domain-containing protein n=1 Tax=Hymenobacter metallicola TaxID=2563114 RepID=UPI003741FFB2
MTVELRGTSAHLLTITDVRGAIIRTATAAAGTATTNLDLTTLPRGIYLLTVQSGSGVEVQKIIKH